jgi:hypothetical protein
MITDTNQGARAAAQTPRSGAEARGFEPRKGVNPNRISSTILCVSSYANHGQIFLFLLVTALAVCRTMMGKAGPFW